MVRCVYENLHRKKTKVTFMIDIDSNLLYIVSTGNVRAKV